MTASIFDAYLAGGASELFPSSFNRADDRLHAVKRAGTIAPTVLARLEAQNQRFGPSTARAAQLAALEKGAGVVVTGQQVGLFLGPLYTIYKAASAVRWAQRLSEETGRAIVPVFWLQTEDHDLAEIAHCTLQRTEAEPLTLDVPIDPRNHVSIAHLKLPPAIRECHLTLEREIGGLPEARIHLDRLARHYQPGARWSDAFAGVLAELFEPEGLLVIDPRDPVLAHEVCAVHRKALDESDRLGRALAARSDALSASGYEAVVHVRSDAPLSFYHPEGPDGPRYRLEPSGARWSEIGGTRSHELQQLRAALERDPTCFSTSALLRPIAQDTLLPTVAYVGGPAEVSYYAQLAPLYEAFGKSMPLVVPRARFRVIEPAAARTLRRYALTPSAAEQSEEALLLQLSAGSAEGPTPDAFEAALRSGFEAVLADVLADFPEPLAALQGTIDKSRRKLEVTSQKLASRYAHVRASRDESTVREVQRLRAMLQPNGVPQEREYGLAYFASRFGERAFLERVLEAIEPFDAARKELWL